MVMTRMSAMIITIAVISPTVSLGLTRAASATAAVKGTRSRGGTGTAGAVPSGAVPSGGDTAGEIPGAAGAAAAAATATAGAPGAASAGRPGTSRETIQGASSYSTTSY